MTKNSDKSKKSEPRSNLSEKSNKKLSGKNGEEFNLETYLFGSANILRGVVDASDFKAYIFPLLFYKRISDVYDEEYEKALKESKDKEFAQAEVNHRFVIPEGCHWNDLRNKSSNLGQHLQKSLREIEKANPKVLYGIFGDTNWGNKEKITDALMHDLIDYFSKVYLSNSKIEQDILGKAYEYLIKKFADLTNKKAGEFYTPRSVITLMTEILDPSNTDTIYDPACGTAGMLLEAAEHVRRKKQDVRRLKLFGQESNLNTSAIARINLFLHGLDDAKIIRGDTLREPAFSDQNKLAKFDYVIANPPFSLKEWGYKLWERDPYGRAFAGLPPKNNGDMAWIQHMLSSTKDTGRCAVVISNGALFRSTEKEIRKKILQQDLLSCIINLGPNLFYGTGLSPSILVFKKRKEKSEKENVLMIDASEIYEQGRAQNYLRDQHIQEIMEIYQNRRQYKNKSKIVTLLETEQNDWNLSVSRYVEKKSDDSLPDLQTALKNVQEAFDLQQKTEAKLKELLIKEDFLER